MAAPTIREPSAVPTPTGPSSPDETPPDAFGRRGWLALAAFYLLGALWLSYPAWLSLDHAVIGDWRHPDMISNHWLYRWVAEQLLSGGSLLHNPAYYFPFGDAPFLAGNGSDAVPYTLVAALVPWPGSTTLWVLLMLVLNGLSGAVLARSLGARWGGALVSGALVLWSPYIAQELGCGRFAQGPLYLFGFFLASWVRLLDAPSLRRGVLAGLLYAATAVSYWYYGLWAAMAGAVLFAFQPRPRALLSFVPVALAATLPPLWVFLRAWAQIPGTDEGSFPHPMTLDAALSPLFPFWGGTGPYQELTTPVLLVVLAALALRGRPRPRLWLGLAVAGGMFYVLAWGPSVMSPDGTATSMPAPFRLLYGLASPLRRFWWPYRHIAGMTLCLAPLAGLAVDRLAQARGWRWLPLLVAVAVPVDLALRDGSIQTAVSYWDPPPDFAALADLDDGVLVEVPLANSLAHHQQSLSYQWIHGHTLLNGHAQWVDRVRPAGWDDWVMGNSLLAGVVALELGELPDGHFSMQESAVPALREAGVRWIVLNNEYLAGALVSLSPRYRALFTALFGEPVFKWEEDLRVWDLHNWTGVTQVQLVPFSPRETYLTEDGSKLPDVAPVLSYGWRPLGREFPPNFEPDSLDEDIVGEEASNEELPPMIRRQLERRRNQ